MQSRKEINYTYEIIYPLIYGLPVTLKDKDNLKKPFIIKLNDTNFSFVELLSESLKIGKVIFIYDIIRVMCRDEIGGLENEIEFRMKNYNENFVLILETTQMAKNIIQIFKYIQKQTEKYPWSAYSIKNLIRKTLYNAKIAKIGNQYTLEELDQLLFYLRINLGIDEKNKLIKKTVQNTDCLNQYDFRRVFKVLMIKEELAPIFKELLNIGQYEKIGKLSISLQTLYNWIKAEQEEQLQEQTIRNFFLQININNIFIETENQISNREVVTEQEKQVIQINFEEFCLFMYSRLNTVINLKKQNEYLNENYPLCSYFINSSFNTYLWGDLLYGQVSLEYYLRVIERGVRFLQLRIFDGLDAPIISKNGSSDTYILLESFLEFIKKIAFKDTNSPMILHLLIDCNKTTRNQIAQLLYQHLGNSLYQVSKESFMRTQMPTLREFQNKFIIMARAALPNFKFKSDIKKSHDQLSWYTTFFSERYDEEGLNSVFNFSSIREGKLDELQKNHFLTYKDIQFHQNNLNMIYPDLSREDSSNQNPLKGWNMGAQMVCLNLQNQDIYNLYNQAQFNNKRNRGFVLKPQCLLSTQPTIEPINPEIIIRITVIGSQLQSLQKEGSDYIFNYVEMKIDGPDKDKLSNKTLVTKVHQANYFHSIFINEENDFQHEFSIYHPDLSLLIVNVKNAKDQQILKSNVFCINQLRSGLRSVPLIEDFLVDDEISYILVDIRISKFEPISKVANQIRIIQIIFESKKLFNFYKLLG